MVSETWGCMSPEFLSRFLRSYVRVLRRILKRRGAPRPPCHTCAFNPATDDWRGFEKTMVNLMESIHHGRPFVCHEGLPRDPTGQWCLRTGEMPPLCAGYEAIKDDPETKRAALEVLKGLPVQRKSAPPPE